MEPIPRNDYYSMFQTGLLIALEKLRVKQAQVADVCGISKGYLSKLKGWQVDTADGTLLSRPHVTSTNFRKYAVPLQQFLETEHGIVFTEGFFTHSVPGDDPPERWGCLRPVDWPARRPLPRATAPSLPSAIEGLDIPEAGELAIEWSIDFTDPAAVQRMLEQIKRLAQQANAQLTVKVVLRKSAGEGPPLQHKTHDLRELRAEPRFDIAAINRFLDANPHLEVQSSPGGRGYTELVAVTDAGNGVQREQFCDFSDWKALYQRGNWSYHALPRRIQGSGLNQYILSRGEYGRRPFKLHAVLSFDGYARHAGHHAETANAGLILGWKNEDGRDAYYHLLLDGQTMRLEQVGAQGGDPLLDFRHLDAGVPFALEDGAEYRFLLHAGPERIAVFVDGVQHYETATPPGLQGRVGIRPWRAHVQCSYFEVWEDAEV